MSRRTEGLKPGDQGEVGGVDYRILRGKKTRPRYRVREGEVDAVIQIRTAGGVWVQPRHEFLLWLTKFMYENEDILWPPEEHPRWRGGLKIMDALDETVGVTFAAGRRRLETEIRTRRERHA